MFGEFGRARQHLLLLLLNNNLLPVLVVDEMVNIFHQPFFKYKFDSINYYLGLGFLNGNDFGGGFLSCYYQQARFVCLFRIRVLCTLSI